MKVVIEKVVGPEALRISITHDTSKKPLVVTIQPAELNQYIELLRTGMASEVFRIEFQN